MIMYKRLFVLLALVGWANPAWAVPTGWFSWTNTGSPSTLAITGASPTWEDSPAGGDDISRGDDRIRQLKFNIRLRENAEHCWDAASLTGCGAGNSGRLRIGGARVFAAVAAPSVLNGTDANGSAALDDGRVFIDLDGADNSMATLGDNNTVQFYFHGAWANTIAMGVAGTTTNDFKLWNGVGWTNTPAATTTISSGSNADATNAAVPASLTELGGATGTAVIPATGAYLIHVTGDISVAAISGAIYVGLKEYDGTTATVVRACWFGNSNGATTASSCNFNYYKDAPTAGLTYTYTIEIQSGGGTVVYNAQMPTLVGLGTGGHLPRANLQVVRMSKTLPTGF